MPVFRYQAVDPRNTLSSGTIDASDAQAVADRLLARGLTPYEIILNEGATRGSPRLAVVARSAKLPLPDVVEFLSQFGMLTKAGLDAGRASEFIVRSARSGKVRRVATKCAVRIYRSHPSLPVFP